jgi:hypothetical protein
MAPQLTATNGRLPRALDELPHTHGRRAAADQAVGGRTVLRHDFFGDDLVVRVLVQTVFEMAQFGDVLENEQHADRVVIRIAQHRSRATQDTLGLVGRALRKLGGVA